MVHPGAFALGREGEVLDDRIEERRHARSEAETRELAANLRTKFPEITQAELARQLGISATRLRQVERAEGSHPINGNAVPQLEEVSA